MAITLLSDASVEPVTLAEARTFCRETTTDKDAILSGLIVTARKMAEHETGRSLVQEMWKLTLDQFPVAIEIPRGPLISVHTVRYLDATETWRTIDPSCYVVDAESVPAWVVPGTNYAWPETAERLNAVEVIFWAGYGDTAATVPEPIKTWMLIRIAHWLDNPSASNDASGAMRNDSVRVLGFLDRMLDEYRVVNIP